VWFDNDDNSEGKTVAMVCLNTLKVYYYNLAENVRPVWVCENCGGSNVQTKGWVLPNENNKFIDLVSEEINDNWCEDCDSHTCLVSIATMDGHINPDK